MKAVIMDGRALAEKVKNSVRDEVKAMKERGVGPCLATVLIGDDPNSELYLKLKHRGCSEVGILSKNYRLPANAEEGMALELIRELNEDESIDGILVQLPIPRPLDGLKIVGSVSPEKDVDGLSPYNLGLASYKRGTMMPCTPKGIMALLEYYRVGLEGKHVVIVNRSNLVGRPLSLLLANADPLQMVLLNIDALMLNSDATVTVCHSKTRELEGLSRQADVLVSAVGRRPEFMVRGDMVKPGAVVIDVGISQVGSRVYGDIDLEEVAKKASYVTPVPGGVGPMTVAMLLHNTLIAAEAQSGLTAKPLLEGLAYDIKE